MAPAIGPNTFAPFFTPFSYPPARPLLSEFGRPIVPPSLIADAKIHAGIPGMVADAGIPGMVADAGIPGMVADAAAAAAATAFVPALAAADAARADVRLGFARRPLRRKVF